MATFGQGINPQFGAIDYSPIQRGAAVGAQLAAQGGSMIGQGLANLGQEVGKGVEEYYKKKEKTELKNRAITTFQSLGKANPEFIKMLGIKDIEDTGVVGAVVETLGGADRALQLGKALNDASTQRQATALGNLYTRAGNTNLSPIDKQFNPIEYSPESQRIARGQFMQDQLAEANIKKAQSEARLNEATAGAKVSLAGYGTLKESQESVKGNADKYTFHVIGNRYIVLPIDAKTALEVEALGKAADAVEAGKTAESALKAAGGTPETHKVEWTGNKFTATPFNKTELLEIKAKQGVLDEKDKKTLFERRQYGNKIDNELYAANIMKDQIAALKTDAANTQPGFWTALVSNIPGTASANLVAQIDTIISKIGFDRLLQMMGSSPNGSSGLGALNATELEGLRNSLANLKKSQSGPQFQSNLEIVQKYYDRVITSLEADKRDFSSSGSSAKIPMWNSEKQVFE